MEYFRDIAVCSAVCGIVIYLSPSASSGKYVKYLSALVLLLVLLSPLISLRSGANELTDRIKEFFTVSVASGDESYSAALSMNAEALSKSLKTSLMKSFSLSEDELSVCVTIEGAKEISDISVELRLNTDREEEILSYMKSLGFENCKITKDLLIKVKPQNEKSPKKYGREK